MTLTCFAMWIAVASGADRPHSGWAPVCEEIVEASVEIGIHPAYALATGLRESDLRPGIMGADGESGPMQVHPVHGPAGDPVRAGVAILARHLRECGTAEEALAAYKRGHCVNSPAGVSRMQLAERIAAAMRLADWAFWA